MKNNVAWLYKSDEFTADAFYMVTLADDRVAPALMRVNGDVYRLDGHNGTRPCRTEFIYRLLKVEEIFVPDAGDVEEC